MEESVYAWKSFRRFLGQHRGTIYWLVLIGSAAFLVRFIVLTQYPAPPGADYGNYLTNLHALYGQDVTGGGVQYPMVFMLYLSANVALFGELGAFQFSGPILAALITLPGYFFLRRFVDRPYALLGTALLVFSEGISEMIGWGGNPNLLGILFGTSFLAFMHIFITSGRRRDLAASACSLALLAGSHQVSLVFFAVAAMLMLLSYGIVAKDRRGVMRGFATMGVGLVLALPFAPFYWTASQLGAGALLFRPPAPSVGDIAYITQWLFRESLWIWIPVAFLAALGYAQMVRRDSLGFSMGFALVASPPLLAVTLMAVDPVRPFYFVYLGIVPGAMAYAQRAMRAKRPPSAPVKLWARRTSFATLIVVAVALFLVTTAFTRMDEAANWYYVARPDVLGGLQWIRQNVPRSVTVATNGPMKYGAEASVGCMWGWWIEGYAERDSLCTANPRSLAWDSQVRAALDADRAFAGNLSMENGLVRIGDYAPFGSAGNPIVAGDFGRGYEPFVYFSDSHIVATWHPKGGPVRQAASPFYLANRTVISKADAAHGSIEFTADQAGLAWRRTVEIDRDSPMVWVNFSLSAPGPIDSLVLSIYNTSNSRLNAFDFGAGILSIQSAPEFQEGASGLLRVVKGSANLTPAALETNGSSSISMLSLSFAPRSAVFEVSLAILASVAPAALGSAVSASNATAIFRRYGVGYVMVDGADSRNVEWLLNDKSAFQLSFSNAAVDIFAFTGG